MVVLPAELSFSINSILCLEKYVGANLDNSIDINFFVFLLGNICS